MAAGEAVGVVDDDDWLAVTGGDRLERAVDVLEHLAGWSLQIDACERGGDLPGELGVRDPELRGELGRKPTLTAGQRAPCRCGGEDRVPIASGQRAGALGVAHDALDQVRRESPYVEHDLVVIEGDRDPDRRDRPAR